MLQRLSPRTTFVILGSFAPTSEEMAGAPAEETVEVEGRPRDAVTPSGDELGAEIAAIFLSKPATLIATASDDRVVPPFALGAVSSKRWLPGARALGRITNCPAPSERALAITFPSESSWTATLAAAWPAMTASPDGSIRTMSKAGRNSETGAGSLRAVDCGSGAVGAEMAFGIATVGPAISAGRAVRESAHWQEFR